MAKRKNATALFEVMAAHRAKQQARDSGEPTPSAATAAAAPPPGQLFRSIGLAGVVDAGRRRLVALLEGRSRRADEPDRRDELPRQAAADPTPDPTAGMTARSLSARPPADPARAAAAPPAGPVTYTTAMPTYGRSCGEDPSAPPADRPDPRGRNQVAIDRDRQQVTLKVRFTTVGIGAVALLVVMGLAYIVGKRAGSPAATPAAAQPAKQPGVLDPRRASAARPAAKAGDPAMADHRVPAAGRDARADVQPSGPGGVTQVATATGGLPFVDAHIINNKAQRRAGLNYCVIATYPVTKEDTAVEVSNFLNDNGVPNTVEFCQAREPWTVQGFVLVGVRGFGSALKQSPEYDPYMQALFDAADKFARPAKFGRPKPLWVKLER